MYVFRHRTAERAHRTSAYLNHSMQRTALRAAADAERSREEQSLATERGT
jgi:hypothetical protein